MNIKILVDFYLIQFSDMHGAGRVKINHRMKFVQVIFISSFSLSVRKNRARRRIRRKNKIYMASNPVHKNEEIELKSFKANKSPVKEETIQVSYFE